jgi:hypothetical protein
MDGSVPVSCAAAIPRPKTASTGATLANVLDHAEVVRLYGPWKVRTPREAVDFSAVTRVGGGSQAVGDRCIHRDPRAHGDLDIGIPRSDAESFIKFVGASLDVWAAAGSLTPLSIAGSSVPEDCGNLWLRPSGADPWEYDVLLDHVREQTWVYVLPTSRGPSAIVCGHAMASRTYDPRFNSSSKRSTPGRKTLSTLSAAFQISTKTAASGLLDHCATKTLSTPGSAD